VTRIFDEETIRSALDPAEIVAPIARGFADYTAGRVDVPPVGLLHFEDPPGDVHIKYGRVVGGDTYVVKVASGFYDNPSRGLPVSDGSMLLYDAATGELLAILLDRGWLTEVRTGAAGAVAAQHLAPAAVESIGMLGAGVQGRFQLRALAPVVACRRVLAWSRDPGRAAEYAAELSAEGWEVDVAATPQAVAAECSLIVTATPARAPLLQAGDIRPGTHITAMGSDSVGKQELDADVLAAADLVVVDSTSQAFHHGECAPAHEAGAITPADVVELGAVVAGTHPGRTSDEQITVADLTGVAVQDLVIAEAVYRRLTGRSGGPRRR